MACTTYPAPSVPHCSTNQIKYSLVAKICLGCDDHVYCKSGLSVLEGDTCRHNIIGQLGLRKLGLDTAGQLLQGDFIRVELSREDWSRGLPTLVSIDYGYHGELELTKADFRDVEMMEAQRHKRKLCMLRISRDPNPALKERFDREKEASSASEFEEQERKKVQTIARKQKQEEEARDKRTQ